MSDTCYRLIGEPGDRCRTCGRLIVRRDLSRGAHAYEHEGLSVAAKLREINERRKAGSA